MVEYVLESVAVVLILLVVGFIVYLFAIQVISDFKSLIGK